MSNMQLTGKLHSATQTEQKSDSFKVRTFILETEDVGGNQVHINHVQFQLVNNNVELLTGFAPGQHVRVSFNVRGKLWTPQNGGEQKCITNLNAWKIEPVQQQQPQQPQYTQQSGQSWAAQPQHQPTPALQTQMAPPPPPQPAHEQKPTQSQSPWGQPQQNNGGLPF